MSKVTMWRSRWRCVIKPTYSVSFLFSINIFVWQNVLCFPNDLRSLMYVWVFMVFWKMSKSYWRKVISRVKECAWRLTIWSIGCSRNFCIETNILRCVKSRKISDLKHQHIFSNLELYNTFYAFITVTSLFDSVSLVTWKPFHGFQMLF